MLLKALGFPFALQDLNRMMLASYSLYAMDPCFTCAAWNGACAWLENNRNVWTPWIPQKNACFAGQGMYNAPQLQTLEIRISATHGLLMDSPVLDSNIVLAAETPDFACQ